MKKMIIATRSSPLALAQVEIFIKELEKLGQKREHIEILALKTQGDKDLSTPLFHKGGKGLFIREVERAVLEEKADFAVHSLKDLPLGGTAGLSLSGFLATEGEQGDIVIRSQKGQSNRVGTSSQRRAAQWKILNKESFLLPLRGSVQRRLEQNDGEKFSAILLAYAGVARLGLDSQLDYKQLCPWTEMTPAFCQGIIGIQARSSNGPHQRLLEKMTEKKVFQRQYYERYIASLFGASCQSAFGVFVDVGEKSNKVVVFAYRSPQQWKRECFAFDNQVDLTSELKKRFDYEHTRWSHCEEPFFSLMPKSP